MNYTDEYKFHSELLSEEENHLSKKLEDSLKVFEKLSVKLNKPKRFQTTLENMEN